MMNHFFPSLIILLVLVFFSKYFTEPFKTKKEKQIISRWDKFHPYCSSNISKYNMGSPNVNHLYNYWKNRPLHWAKEYNVKNLNFQTTKVKSNVGQHLPYRKTSTKGVDSGYYHDPSNYKGLMFYPETYMPHQEPVDKVSTANHRVLDGLHYNGIKILKPLEV